MKRAWKPRRRARPRQDRGARLAIRPSRSSPIPSAIYRAEQLKGKPIAVSPFNGSHFTTLKLLEGFLKREQIKWVFAGR